MDNESIRDRIRRREDMFLRRLFTILARMAKIDGRIDPWETHAAEGAFARFARANARRKFCVSVFNSAKNGRLTMTTLAESFAQEWATPEDCLVIYEILWDIACAKGVLKHAHKRVLRDICVPLGLPPNYFSLFYRRRSGSFREVEEDEASGENGSDARYQNRRSSRRQTDSEHEKRSERHEGASEHKINALDEAFGILGCSSSDSNDILRHAYREAAKRYHPDLMRAKGLTERQIRAASDMMSRINAAWEMIRKSKCL